MLGFRRLLGISFALSALLCASPVKAASINIAPGSGPTGGYIDMAGFGVTPIAGVGDDTIHNFPTFRPFTWAGQTWNSIGIAMDTLSSAGAPIPLVL